MPGVPGYERDTVVIMARLTWLILAGVSSVATVAAGESIVVFDAVPIELDREISDRTQRAGYVVADLGRTVERTLELPPLPDDQRSARRIVATVEIDPVLTQGEDGVRPADPWTRLGSVTVLRRGEADDGVIEVELLRFVTGFGGAGTFSQDVTPLAPLLAGPTRLRLAVSTFRKPGWKVTLTLTYSRQGLGYRRPVWARPVFFEPAANSDNHLLRASIEVPAGVAQPRLRVISTGHASDGVGGDEFVSRTHVLRIDGKQIIRWRPWSEVGGTLRHLNPSSGRVEIDGRVLWSSDLDRSGWHPGQVVSPLLVPLPELRPGRHRIELEILDIRPPDASGARGYWRLSAVLVADEPWPQGAGGE